MSYIDSIWDRKNDKVRVVERSKEGKRIYREYAPELIFYYQDPKGKYKSIYDEPLAKYATRVNKEFQKELAMHRGKKLYESDISPVARCLETHYSGNDSPPLHIAFFDIEVDFNKEKGFSTIDDPFNPITAISVYMGWLKQMVTLVIPPSGMDWDAANAICEKFENCYLFATEAEMLDTFLSIIEDADILTGWNSGGYDIPYTVQRVQNVLGKDDTRRFCLWGEYPKKRTFEQYGKEQMTFDTIGRVHYDYMDLYKEYTYHEMHSYSLNAISEHELKERKVDYDGTLDQLYNDDFEKFIEYNRQDTLLIYKLDVKLKYIDLASSIAHDNTVTLRAALGAVAVTDQAIINECHSYGLIIPDRIKSDESEVSKAVGAYVAKPKRGMHEWVGAVDINSLYPSAIRALNMSPETIVGQIRQSYTESYILDKMDQGIKFPDAWEGLFASLEYTYVMNKTQDEIIIDWEDGNETKHTAKEVYSIIFESNQKWIVTSNGTIFRFDKKGIVPNLLERWYSERQELQAKKAEASEAGNSELKAYYDKRQLVKKIVLNSAYGALLNQYCRFFDKRIGQSTTLSGRSIVCHMNSYINECIEGTYDHLGKSVAYADTDSCYFSAWPMIEGDVSSGALNWSKETCIDLYENIADQVNESFPPYMLRAFNSPNKNGEIIKAGLELIATKGLFIKKKRYALLKFYDDGDRVDVVDKKGELQTGKVKAMGLDLKRSDTPEYMQTFLSEILKNVLDGDDKTKISEKIIEFKKQFANKTAWEMGRPMRANNLTSYTAKAKNGFRGMIPGHVVGCMNWNKLRDMYSDNHSIKITDGQKVVVCRLKDNPMNITCVSYPIDESRLPDWFKELPFDELVMEDKMIDKKIDNLLGILKWNLENATDIRSTFNTLFQWE